MDRRTKEKIARELTSGGRRATKNSMRAYTSRLPEEEQKDLAKRKR